MALQKPNDPQSAAEQGEEAARTPAEGEPIVPSTPLLDPIASEVAALQSQTDNDGGEQSTQGQTADIPTTQELDEQFDAAEEASEDDELDTERPDAAAAPIGRAVGLGATRASTLGVTDAIAIPAGTLGAVAGTAIPLEGEDVSGIADTSSPYDRLKSDFEGSFADDDMLVHGVEGHYLAGAACQLARATLTSDQQDLADDLDDAEAPEDPGPDADYAQRQEFKEASEAFKSRRRAIRLGVLIKSNGFTHSDVVYGPWNDNPNASFHPTALCPWKREVT